MGTSTLSLTTLNALKWGLPALTFAFTWWQPAAIQITFFVSGLMSFFQASLFRVEWFRRYFDMTPLPKPTDAAPPSRYKGKLKIAADPVLSQAELSQRFQGAQGTSPLQGKLSKIRESKAPGGVFGKISGTFKEVSDAGSGVVVKAKDTMADRKEKADIRDRQEYEVKKQKQLKKERWQRENERIAERAARKVRR
jgi:YidC/Oxa1 family membrane protein insertase